MKTKHFLFSALAVLMVFYGCKKSETETPVTDTRDAFVGNYTETYQAIVTVNILGQTQTDTTNGTGTFHIEKLSSAGRIVRIDDSDTLRYEGTVSGSHVIFDTKQGSETQQGMTLSYTLTGSGDLNGNKLNYSMVMTGSVFYMGGSFPLNGTVKGVATKQ